jgi:hypothetical protein
LEDARVGMSVYRLRMRDSPYEDNLN